MDILYHYWPALFHRRIASDFLILHESLCLVKFSKQGTKHLFLTIKSKIKLLFAQRLSEKVVVFFSKGNKNHLINFIGLG